jgi:EmrB/QacA subfamily drug resistance transporter
MSAVDSTIVATGLQTIRLSLHARINWAAWIITSYQLGLAIGMPIAGRLADQFGRKQVFLVAATVFTAASLLCGLATSIWMLIALRVVQALGGSAFIPTATGVVYDAFGKDRNRALGFFSSIFPLGAMTGPILGGIIIANWSWRGVFLVNVPVGMIFTLLAIRYLPSSAGTGGRADLAGALLFGATILSAMLAVTRLGDRGATLSTPEVILPALTAIMLATLFVYRASHVAHPLVPIYLLKGRVFAAMNTINLVWGCAALGFGTLVPLYAQLRYHLSPISSGTLLTARAIGEIGVAFAVSFYLTRIGFRIPMIIGFVLLSVGLWLIAAHPQALGPYTWLAAAAGLTGIGMGFSAPSTNNASIEISPRDIGTISGLRSSIRQAGAIMGVALASSVAARSHNQANALAYCFVGLSFLLLLLIPLTWLVPSHPTPHPDVMRPSDL